MRSRTQQKTYMQEARSVDEAINRATRHFRTLGFKVHTATVQEQTAPEAPKQNLTEGFMGSPYSNAYKEAKKVIDPKYHDTLLGALKSMADGKDEAETFNKINLGSGHKDAKKILTKHGIDTVLEEDVQDTQTKINAAKDKREAAMKRATTAVDDSRPEEPTQAGADYGKRLKAARKAGQPDPQNEQTALEKYLARKAMMAEQAEVEQIQEELKVSDGAAAWIDDFVKSKNPKFDEKTKKERIQMALGAFYAAKRALEEQVAKEGSEGISIEDMVMDQHHNGNEVSEIASNMGMGEDEVHDIINDGGKRLAVKKQAVKEEVKLEEGADERKQNALWAQITAHEKAAKKSKDLKQQHHLKMADQLRSQLKTSDKEQVEEARAMDYKMSRSGVTGDRGDSKGGDITVPQSQKDEIAKIFAKKDDKKEVKEAAEGTTPTTAKERELAAKAGDPNKITKKDVLAARGVKLEEVKGGYKDIATEKAEDERLANKKEAKDTKSAKAAETIVNLAKSKKNKVNLDPKIDHSKG
jgi:hypothetical protein